MAALFFVGEKAATKLLEVGVDKLLGIEVQVTTVENWGETLVLAVFTGGV
jgi:hypothetical protein